jgi:hypothetical protein
MRRPIDSPASPAILPSVSILELFKNYRQRLQLGDVAVFENRQPVTAAKFINKSSLFIL